MPAVLLCALLGVVSLSDAFRVRQRRKQKGSVRVGTLGDHRPGGWGGACKTADGSLERAQCNLNVYEEAAKTAKSAGVDILVLPEYGLLNGGNGFHSDVAPSVGDQPCGLSGSSHAQVSRLSCIARNHSVALASNLQTNRGGHTYITEIVYDKAGTVVATYDKHELYPGMIGAPAESTWAKAGPFKPTVFTLFGQKWGLAICHEGMNPDTDWSIFYGLRDRGAQHVIWSVGNTGIGSSLLNNAKKIADKVQGNVFSCMNKALLWGDSTAMVRPDGSNHTRTRANLDRASLSALGYSGSPYINYANV